MSKKPLTCGSTGRTLEGSTTTTMEAGVPTDTLYFGDCLDVMREDIPDGSVGP
ncbi:MAG: hypothetical protein OXL34_08515 [Gemmatimonadota bacterium]|nr:hypothetical protein [Gemmatimonadota bacterium]